MEYTVGMSLVVLVYKELKAFCSTQAIQCSIYCTRYYSATGAKKTPPGGGGRSPPTP